MSCCGGGKEKKPQGGLNKKKNKTCIKIVLLGNVAVGKTSITQRYVYEKFDNKYFNTLGGAYVEKIIQTKDGQQAQLNIWDTAGDERYRSIMPLYYRDAAAAVLVYDVSDTSSFNDLNYWIEELQNKVQTDGMVLCLIGNKNDIDPSLKQVPTSMAEKFAIEKNLLFGEVSAKTGDNVEETFQKLITQLELLKKTGPQ